MIVVSTKLKWLDVTIAPPSIPSKFSRPTISVFLFICLVIVLVIVIVVLLVIIITHLQII